MGKNLTQMARARQGEVTPEIKLVASRENLPEEEVMEKVARGTIVIPANIRGRHRQPCGIGQGLRTKINANIGTSEAFPQKERERAKLKAALEAGADAVMDLSTGGDLKGIRAMILEHSSVPVGTVPIYEAAVRARLTDGGVLKMKEEDLFAVIEEHAADGVDFMTLHCGLTRAALDSLRSEGRIMGVVSRGGAILAGWMLEKDRENPLYENFDRILEIARRYDVTLSLGDGMRPGCLEDATDRAQLQELLTLGELVQRAREAEVQVMVEGPGHMAFDQIETNIKAAKAVCKGAPFYVLGPLVTDIAPGYDHITAAIGGTMAAVAGADFLCYVTPTEHLGLPGPEEVHQGIMASRIAAHAADVVKGIKGAREWDREMSLARRRLDWERQLELSLDPGLARSLYERLNPQKKEECTMCGSFCALKIVKEYL